MSDSDKLDPPRLVTDTHLYTILPVEEWPVAAEFVCETVSPDVAFPNDPERFSILAAINRSSGEIDGMIAVGEVFMVDHFACRSGAKVSYSKLHELLRSVLAPGTVYYTAVGDSVGGRHAANHAALKPHGLLMISITGEEGGGEDAVDSVGGSSSIGGGELPGVAQGGAGGETVGD